MPLHITLLSGNRDTTSFFNRSTCYLNSKVQLTHNVGYVNILIFQAGSPGDQSYFAAGMQKNTG